MAKGLASNQRTFRVVTYAIKGMYDENPGLANLRLVPYAIAIMQIHKENASVILNREHLRWPSYLRQTIAMLFKIDFNNVAICNYRVSENVGLSLLGVNTESLQFENVSKMKKFPSPFS